MLVSSQLLVHFRVVMLLVWVMAVVVVMTVVLMICVVEMGVVVVLCIYCDADATLGCG